MSKYIFYFFIGLTWYSNIRVAATNIEQEDYLENSVKRRKTKNIEVFYFSKLPQEIQFYCWSLCDTSSLLNALSTNRYSFSIITGYSSLTTHIINDKGFLFQEELAERFDPAKQMLLPSRGLELDYCKLKRPIEMIPSFKLYGMVGHLKNFPLRYWPSFKNSPVKRWSFIAEKEVKLNVGFLIQSLPSQTSLLNIEKNDIGPKECMIVAHNLHLLKELEEIYLDDNNIQETGFESLMEILPQTNIKILSIHSNNIKYTNRNLFKSPFGNPLAKLEELYLSDNQLGDTGIAMLTLSLSKIYLRILDIGLNEIGEIGIKAIAKVLPNTDLRDLWVGSNLLTNEGFKALAHALRVSKIQSISLQSTDIGDKGLKILAKILPETQIKDLSLYDNGIGSKNMKLFADCLLHSYLDTIDLDKNCIDDAGIHYLNDAFLISNRHIHISVKDQYSEEENI